MFQFSILNERTIKPIQSKCPRGACWMVTRSRSYRHSGPKSYNCLASVCRWLQAVGTKHGLGFQRLHLAGCSLANRLAGWKRELTNFTTPSRFLPAPKYSADPPHGQHDVHGTLHSKPVSAQWWIYMNRCVGSASNYAGQRVYISLESQEEVSTSSKT